MYKLLKDMIIFFPFIFINSFSKYVKELEQLDFSQTYLLDPSLFIGALK